MMNFNGIPQMNMMNNPMNNQMNMMNIPMNNQMNIMNNQMNMMNNQMNEINNQICMNNQMNMMNNNMNMNNQIQLNPQMNDFNNPMQMNLLTQMQMQMQNLANNLASNMLVMAGQTPNMNQMQNNIQQQGGNELSLKFVINDGKNSTIIIPCIYTEKMADIFERFWTKIGGKRDPNAKFVHNAKNISPSLSVSECGLMNQNQIQVLLSGRVQGA